MQRGTALSIDETYHIYNRGAHKSELFLDDADYKRFHILLYIVNTSVAVNIKSLLRQNKYKGKDWKEANFFENETVNNNLVEILAYCLMPNHFHLVLRQKVDLGIEIFMRKLGTAYSMYFNKRYAHSGVLLQGRYQSKHIDTESYFRYIFAYVHLNPLSLIEGDWEVSGINNPVRSRSYLASYTYSSYVDYSIHERPATKILTKEGCPDFLKETNDLEDLITACKNENIVAKDGPRQDV